MRNGRVNMRRPHHHNRMQNFDSNGPDVRIRGSANQILEKYLALARDANATGDRIAAENYLQHAEHYFRIVREAGSSQQPHPSGPRRSSGRSGAVTSGEEDDRPKWPTA